MRASFTNIILIAVAVAATALRVYAVSVLLGIEPGRSTRAEAEKVFGAPIGAEGRVVAYKPQGGASGIEIEYTDANIVNRIELRFTPAVAPAEAAKQLGLPPAPDGTRNSPESRLIEYFGGSRTLVLTHETAKASSGIVAVGYYSRELFQTEGVIQQRAAPSSAVQLSNPKDAPVIVEFNPVACEEVFRWAQKEHEAVKKIRKPAQRASILEVMVAAQRGDCAKARMLTDKYRQMFR